MQNMPPERQWETNTMILHRTIQTAALGTLLAVTAPAVAQELGERREAARAAAMTLVRELGGELQQAMESGGPVAAVSVCSERAPAITARISRERGWEVTRVSSRYRNPLLGMPDAWERQTLERFRGRHADGESYKGMSRGEVVTEGERTEYRYMQALPTKGVCVACHGPKEALDPGVRATLDERYPHDMATGFAVGDLRGAVSIRQPID